jgi:hypothetical protein
MPSKHLVTHICAICDRSLLVGERAIRFTPDDDGEFVDVCPLCQETALAHGWIREGSPVVPTFRGERRRSRLSLGSIFGGRRGVPAAAAPAPALAGLSEDDQAIVEAAELFNVSLFRRTVEGISKSLGAPRVSIVPLSGVNKEVVMTFVWDISWYQYRVSFDSAQPVRLAERGLDPDDLDATFTTWNAGLDDAWHVVPDVGEM